MPLITTSVPNLVQGVSQQPDNLRYPGQGESQKNAYSTVVNGLSKRPNTRHVAEIVGTPINNDALIHLNNRDDSNNHVFILDDAAGSSVTIQAFNLLNGSEVTTSITSDATAYLSTTNPLGDVKALTIADYTFLVNKEKVIAMESATSAALAEEALVFIKQGDYEKKYTITLDGADKTATSGASTSGTNADSETIAAQLITALGSVSGYTFTRTGSVIKIVKTSGMTISVSDGLANTGLGMVFKEVDGINDLPKKAYNGFRVKVRGDVEATQDDYYVKFETKDSAAFGEGSWVEDIGYGIKTTIDKTTMPVVMVPTINPSTGLITAYTIECAGETSASNSWGNRTVGDYNESTEVGTNPAPSFIGKKINDVFFFKNRLGFLTDNTVVFSEADSYFNFFRTTVLSLLDSAPIDVGLAHTKVSILKHAVPFQEKLVLFSPQSQFVLRGTDLLTPKTVNVSPITEYDVAEDIKPLALMNFIYFPFKRGNFHGIYEFFVDKSTDVFDASEITAQTPRYIPTSIRQLIGTPAEDVIIATTEDNLKHLYVYKYFWQNKEKIQSAWSRFEFAHDIVGGGFVDSDLFIVTKDSGGTYLEKIPMEVGLKEAAYDFTIHLDRRLDGAGLTHVRRSAGSSTDLAVNLTGLPYDPDGAVVYTSNGSRHEVTRTSATACTVDYDLTGISAWWLGFEYDLEYEFSTQTLKQPTERGGKSTSNFTYQILRNGAVDYADTGHFKIEVTPLYRDTYTYPFNPAFLGADSLIQTLVLGDGSFRFPIHAQHDEATIKITSSSALPMKILGAEFESFVTPRSRRYGG